MRSISREMDERHIGLQQVLLRDTEYQTLRQELDEQRMTISASSLNQRITDSLEAMYALMSIELLEYYTKPKRYRHLLPKHMIMALNDMKPAVERSINSLLVLVNNVLEPYRLGEKADG